MAERILKKKVNLMRVRWHCVYLVEKIKGS